ncbi:hypothetical protein [Actinoplanes couchii]|uniref:Uncharacterized protein n=1 Tax=Actinoplanes couchii TaxID=403638 RepID=A0ABQ3XRF2_9ACTN|nr:hypothetical protein [Actinoplanes couchii]MDR6321500.1 putative membrane protein [Actinoplanes couchii]GID61093.1 hypothetical protein Aco03nite_094970 [Actinoplanes couchii]
MYALRSAAFTAAYLTVFLTSAVLPWFPVPTLAVAAVWLTAQTGYGRRRLDVIMLATAAAVGATLNGASLLMCVVVALIAVLPALLFAVLLQRLLPGYWLGHGDRFRNPRAALARMAVIAPATAAAGAVMETVAGTDHVMLRFVLGTVAVFLAPLAVRATRTQSDRPGRRRFTVVR